MLVKAFAGTSDEEGKMETIKVGYHKKKGCSILISGRPQPSFVLEPVKSTLIMHHNIFAPTIDSLRGG